MTADSPMGTQERKRTTKAMPSRVQTRSWGSWGCLSAIVLYVALYALIFLLTRTWVWLAFGIPAAILLIAILVAALRRFLLLAECRRVLEPRGGRFVVVYSESPKWLDHIRTNWLPRLGQTALTLNWTDRATWPNSLEVRLFNLFIKARHNFNPAVLVLRGREQPMVYRFYYAFQNAKAGRTEHLTELEKELFEQ